MQRDMRVIDQFLTHRERPCQVQTILRDGGRSFDAGSRAHMHRDSAEACSGFSDRVSLKGKSAIAIARLSGKERNFTGEHFWARGYAVSTVGFELEQVKKYIRDQEEADGITGRF